ncbi:ABC transporter ATP-binding protein [Rhizobium rhizogenes]|uniref:ABC transporter ATP-binding protein n=1 Tax=Rhizobium rhizogenes TaxID=359 RepID=UPI001572073C|nr:ABC transporter ATP-binding protein [Rhizobium rhizogenes]NTI78663.1 ABC transporter ATP-binding protein [Rhizobium rhizogenes]
MSQSVLKVSQLVAEYKSDNRNGIAVNGLSFEIQPGEAVALVGESGCGKSTAAHAVMGLLPGTVRLGGSVEFDGQDLFSLSPRAFRRLRGAQIGMIFQEPMTSLNPVYTIGNQIAEILNEPGDYSSRAVRQRTLELLDQVSIPRDRINSYPHELSGGQRQRVMIAIAIALNPRLLIADEPTTALDATVQAQIFDLLDKLRRELSMSLLLISHDLSAVARWADRVVVMHHGDCMETIAADELFEKGQHPYTKGLIHASLRLDENLHYTKASLSEIRATQTAGGEYRFDLSEPRQQGLQSQAVLQPAGPILELHDINVTYRGHHSDVRAVQELSLHIGRGETLGLVGESGSGKSSVSRAIMRLVPTSGGTIHFNGNDITTTKNGALRTLRRDIQMIFQDPYASLNPRHSVEDILGGVLQEHGVRHAAERWGRVEEALDQVGLPRSAAALYPFEFSGGQRQRIAIARAILLRPSLIICDEPVSALDVSIQAQILNLLTDLKQEFGLSYLFISHDLAVVQYICDRVSVMKDGKIVESGDRKQIWKNPVQSYTKTLIAAAA